MRKIKILSVFGTRPEAIKMAPLVLELNKRPGFESLVCVSAQHRQMLDSVLEFFGITADYDLDVMLENQTLPELTSRILASMDGVLSKARPDLVLVHGDTTTAFTGALAAFYSKIMVGHVESGLRTYDKYSPYPEEMNRSLIGRISDLHFAPTRQNAANLESEGVRGAVFITGNTVIDAMKYTVGQNRGFISPQLRDLELEGRRVITLTCHRRENYGKPMEDIFSAVRDISLTYPDTLIIYPVHLSPTVRGAAEKCLSGLDNVRLIPPLDTADMHLLMSKSYMVMTDSGGLQEEAPALGKPVLVLRRETERPEAVDAGTVKLAGVDRHEIFRLSEALLTDPGVYAQMSRAVNPYGDGSACRRIADAIEWSFGISQSRPEDFSP